jgi:transposase
MSEKRKYRQFTPDQKAEIVLAGPRGDRTVRDVCCEYDIAETLYYQWRDKLLGRQGRAGQPADQDPRAHRDRRAPETGRRPGRSLGKKTYELEIAGNSRGTGRERPGVQVPRRGRHRAPTSCGGPRRRVLAAEPVPPDQPAPARRWSGSGPTR